MYGLFYDINVDYASILWEDFLNFLPASKNKFLIHHPRWRSIIIHDAIHNSNLAPGSIREGPQPHILFVSDVNLGADLEEPTSLPKSGTTSKPFSLLDSLFQAPSDYDEPSSSAPVSPVGIQSVLKSPSYHISLDYDSLEDDDQDDDKKSEPETFPKSSPVQDNHGEDTPMQMVDIPSSEGLIVDNDPNDMSIVLYSNGSTRTFSIDLDDYSPPTPKESRKKDDVQEPNFSSFQQDPLQDDGTLKETDEVNTKKP
ncbi:unnamed protein product [Lactuca virosa]|uniref:Uncharacterized protein n=1 Tax=Lactuca virosa TaxID=75947 RepID=A0AAU9MZW9_9ASTR|nr:unnamed protein product [Lactuca virosa]